MSEDRTILLQFQFMPDLVFISIGTGIVQLSAWVDSRVTISRDSSRSACARAGCFSARRRRPRSTSFRAQANCNCGSSGCRLSRPESNSTKPDANSTIGFLAS